MADVINSGVPTPIQIYGRAPNGQLQAVTTDGAGNISFAGAGGVPGGLTTQVQYNNTGAFAGTAGLTIVAGVPNFPSGLIVANNTSVSVSGGASLTFGNDFFFSTFGGA